MYIYWVTVALTLNLTHRLKPRGQSWRGRRRGRRRRRW